MLYSQSLFFAGETYAETRPFFDAVLCAVIVMDVQITDYKPTELSVVDQFTKILDKKSTVVGSNVRVDYRGNVMSNKALLSTNNGEEISKHGKL